MPSQLSQAHLEHEFCRDFDRELKRANLSLGTFHKVLNGMGAPGGNGAVFFGGYRLIMKKLSCSITIICLTLLLFVACGQRPKVAEVGKLAPDFTLVDRKGKTWNLAELKGQVVFVNFWATWCFPCIKEMPSMQKLYSSMPANKFEMLAILYNDKPAVADRVVAKQKYTFPILIDPENKAGKAYGLTGVPETYIIDKQGVLREKFLGPVQWDSPWIRQMLMKYTAQR